MQRSMYSMTGSDPCTYEMCIGRSYRLGPAALHKALKDEDHRSLSS